MRRWDDETETVNDVDWRRSIREADLLRTDIILHNDMLPISNISSNRC